MLQFLLYGAALVWAFYMWVLVQQRIQEHLPFRGVIIILGSVTLFTVLTGLLLNARSVKERYGAS